MDSIEYYSAKVEAQDFDDCERITAIARSMPSYYRIFIDEIGFADFGDPYEYAIEVFFKEEHDATLFHLKL